MDDCKPHRLGTRWKAAIAAALAISVAGLSISISTKIDIEVHVTPEEARYGWAGPEAVEQAEELIESLPEFRIEGVKRDNTKANIRLWKYARAVNGGNHLPNTPQQIGDCVSWGAKNAVDYLACVQIARDWANEEFRPAYAPYIYGTSRVQVGGGRIHGDGSVGAWAAEAVKTYGVLAADYEGVPEYSGRVAKTWGRRGPPDEFIAVAREFPIQTVAQVRDADDVRDAVCNGYPCTIASNWGGAYDKRASEKYGRVVFKRSGAWNHQMCIIAYDGSGAEPLYYVLNSWGAGAHPKPTDDAPPGGFWIRAVDVDYITRQGDSYAFSEMVGFPAKDLDFRIIGQQEEFVMAGFTLVGLCAAIAALIVYSTVRAWGKRHRIWLAGAVLPLLIGGVCCGDEPLSFQVIGPQPKIIETSGMCFQIIGDCPTELPEVASKPVVTAYKDFRYGCHACNVLDRHKHELPFDLKWEQAPAWVQSYPTIEWQSADGRRLYFALGTHGDRRELVRRWEWSQRQPAAATAGAKGVDSAPSRAGVDWGGGSS